MTADERADRFSAKVSYTSTCWIWRGAFNNQGYGQFWYDGKVRLAHHFALGIHGEDLGASMTVDHLCRNKLCVNPEHLEIVTHRENNLRGFSPSALNAKKSVCVRGHDLSGENLRLRNRNGATERICSQCVKIHNDARYRKATGRA